MNVFQLFYPNTSRRGMKKAAFVVLVLLTFLEHQLLNFANQKTGIK